jgi:hypothetical protein
LVQRAQETKNVKQMNEQAWSGAGTPIVFLRPIGIAAGDAMRLMDAAKRFDSPVRWRMAPPGVAADVYVAHAFNVVSQHEVSTVVLQPPGAAIARAQGQAGADSVFDSSSSISSNLSRARKIMLDSQGWHRGHPVCIVGQSIDTSNLEEDELAPLEFPDALRELERGLRGSLEDLVGSRMLYTIGAMAWELRDKWATHRLHAIENNQLLAVIEPHLWKFHLLDGCSVQRMGNAHLMPMPRSGNFGAQGFDHFMLEAALWEFAKRCPEQMLAEILPSHFLSERLTHRRAPHLKPQALGDHCVALLRALDTRSRTANELEQSLRMTRPSLLRALTCLALVRAIQPESKAQRGMGQQLGNWWNRLVGRQETNSALRVKAA